MVVDLFDGYNDYSVKTKVQQDGTAKAKVSAGGSPF
jgi:hypothetical protein